MELEKLDGVFHITSTYFYFILSLLPFSLSPPLSLSLCLMNQGREAFHRWMDEAKGKLLQDVDACEEYLWNWGSARSKYFSLLQEDYQAVGESVLKGIYRQKHSRSN